MQNIVFYTVLPYEVFMTRSPRPMRPSYATTIGINDVSENIRMQQKDINNYKTIKMTIFSTSIIRRRPPGEGVMA